MIVVHNAIVLCYYVELKHVITAQVSKTCQNQNIKILHPFEKVAVGLAVLFLFSKDDDNQTSPPHWSVLLDWGMMIPGHQPGI